MTKMPRAPRRKHSGPTARQFLQLMDDLKDATRGAGDRAANDPRLVELTALIEVIQQSMGFLTAMSMHKTMFAHLPRAGVEQLWVDLVIAADRAGIAVHDLRPGGSR